MDALPLGRPRALDAKKMHELLDLIGHGSSVEEAAQVVGVSLRTVQREAKDNEFFDHDLRLALQSADVDCEKILPRAAHTHWRAAAWMLERSDRDHFSKRPPNSCSAETLWDVLAWLIETALEATPPEHREAVFRRTQAAADKAIDVIMPGFADGCRRRMVEGFGARPTPLSDQEYLKVWRDPKNLRIVSDRDEQRRPVFPGANLFPAASPDSAAPAEDARGILSPKMSAATKVATTEVDSQQRPAQHDHRDAEESREVNR
jgi:hypothetical protein